jgi:hypothetical protein
MQEGEAVLGFPGHLLGSIVQSLQSLSQKALPASRSKKALQSLTRSDRPDGNP